MRSIISVCLFLLLFSCGPEENKSETTVINPEDSSAIEKPADGDAGMLCYNHFIGRDSFFIELQQTGDSVTGHMEFRNYQKDKSRGPVRGKLENGIYKLWYEFYSEGMHSVMQVFLKKEENSVIRGRGDMDVKGDTSFFTNPENIRFDQGQVFQKGSCGLLRKSTLREMRFTQHEMRFTLHAARCTHRRFLDLGRQFKRL